MNKLCSFTTLHTYSKTWNIRYFPIQYVINNTSTSTLEHSASMCRTVWGAELQIDSRWAARHWAPRPVEPSRCEHRTHSLLLLVCLSSGLRRLQQLLASRLLANGSKCHQWVGALRSRGRASPVQKLQGLPVGRHSRGQRDKLHRVPRKKHKLDQCALCTVPSIFYFSYSTSFIFVLTAEKIMRSAVELHI